MPHPHEGDVAVDQPTSWSSLATDGQDVGAGLASSPLAVPVFLAGWVGLGVLLGLRLARGGHHRRTMLMLGVGLGPLMLVVAADVRRWQAGRVRPLVLAPGADHGGDLDVLVLVQDRPEHVRSIVPTLAAIGPDIRRVTLARAVEYDWMDGDRDNEVVDAAAAALAGACDLVPVERPALVVYAGTAEAAARQFAARRGRTLVLVAIDESAAHPGHG